MSHLTFWTTHKPWPFLFPVIDGCLSALGKRWKPLTVGYANRVGLRRVALGTQVPLVEEGLVSQQVLALRAGLNLCSILGFANVQTCVWLFS